MEYSLCLDPLFEGYDYYDRAKMAAEIGYNGVELWNVDTVDPARMRGVCEQLGIRVVSFVCSGAWTHPLSAAPREVMRCLERNLVIADEMGADYILLMSGNRLHSAPCQQNIITENLKRAAVLAEKHTARLLLEPLNSLIDHRGYFLDNSGMGYEIMKCVDSPSVRLLFDAYHMQVMEGNLTASLTANMEYTGHIHVAGVPGRGEPFRGEVHYPAVLAGVEAAGYQGCVGAEYIPAEDHTESAAKTLAYLKTQTEHSIAQGETP